MHHQNDVRPCHHTYRIFISASMQNLSAYWISSLGIHSSKHVLLQLFTLAVHTFCQADLFHVASLQYRHMFMMAHQGPLPHR